MAPEPKAPSGSGELGKRIASAAVLAPVALAAEVLGGLPFAAFVALAGLIGFWEWTTIASADDPAWPRIAAAACLAAGILALATVGPRPALVLIGVPTVLALLAGFRLRTPLWVGLGLLYVAVPCVGFILLRGAAPFGWAAILFILLVVWATDVAAYFGGRLIGGPKLWPRVSPKKTWSGALTGLAAAIVVGGLTVALTGTGDARLGLALAVPLSVASQAGDLFESAFKRRFGAKDSGRVIPGHGGVLDRVDGLFGAAALAWLIAAIGLGGEILALPRAVGP